MITISKADYAPFAEAWRNYEEALRQLEGILIREYHSEQGWQIDRTPCAPLFQKSVFLETREALATHDLDVIRSVGEKQEAEWNALKTAVNYYWWCVFFWENLLAPHLELGRAPGQDSVREPSCHFPKSMFSNGLCDIRTRLGVVKHDPPIPAPISFHTVLTTHCYALVETLRAAKQFWHILNDDDKHLVASALTGWISARFNRQWSKGLEGVLTDAELVGNTCLALAESRDLPAIERVLNLFVQR